MPAKTVNNASLLSSVTFGELCAGHTRATSPSTLTTNKLRNLLFRKTSCKYGGMRRLSF